MPSIVYKSLSTLAPLDFKYDFFKNETLQIQKDGYLEGFSFSKLLGLENFRDIAINKNSCLILTSAVNLSSFFTGDRLFSIGEIPGCVKLQTTNSNIFYANYNITTNNFSFDSLEGVGFTILPVTNGQLYESEIIVNDLYLQVDREYPYTVRLGNYITDLTDNYRQRFFCTYQNNTLIIKTKVDNGFRYLSTGEDNILRATGTVLNNVVVNNYIFKTFNFTTSGFNYNFSPSNDWVTYFLDFSNQANNNDLTINKSYTVPTHFLIDFATEEIIKNKIGSINIANLKTGYTPAGGPASVNNSYAKPNTTTN